jgi:hypothetical protein
LQERHLGSALPVWEIELKKIGVLCIGAGLITLATVMMLVWSQPQQASSPEGKAGWDAFLKVLAESDQIADEIESRTGTFPDPGAAARSAVGTPSEEDLDEAFASSVESGQQLLESERLTQLDALIDALSAHNRFDIPRFPMKAYGLPSDEQQALSSSSRKLARLLAARAQVALYNQDSLTAAQHAHRLILISEPWMAHASITERIKSISIWQVGMTEARRIALSTDDETVLGSLIETIDRASHSLGFTHVLEGEKVSYLRGWPIAVKSYMADDSRIYGEYIDRVIQWNELPVQQRTGTDPDTWLAAQPAGAGIPMLAQSVQVYLTAERAREQQVNATRLVIMLQRYTRDLGAFPPTLADLVPDYLEVVPADPFSSDGFIYRPQPDPHTGAPFTLYSVGDDGVDNGGLIHPEGNYQATQPQGAGHDVNFTQIP